MNPARFCRSRAIVLLGMLVVAGAVCSSARACSAFMLKGDECCVIGFNENWKSMPGMVLINPRGVTKRGLSWKQLVSREAVAGLGVTWTSKFGSVSFSLLGVDLPCYGVNEKGLFIVELYLKDTYTIPDVAKPSLFWAHWIQYQLDNHASVKEVINALESAPLIDWWPGFPGSHFYLADASGDTAAIEWIEGKCHVVQGVSMPVPVLCNGQYKQDYETLCSYAGFGGSKAMGEGASKSIDRFVKASYAVKNFDPKASKPVDFAWRLLDSIRPGEWQLVYDMKNRVLQWRTDVSRETKSLRLDALNFDKASRCRFVDMDATGDALSLFAPISSESNESYVRRGFVIGYANEKFPTSDDFKNIIYNLYRYVRETYR